ncbi:MAG: Uma2 family endonuclease [Sporichthyaceae bacterium]
MRALILEVPESMLAERRRLGLDVRDEMWDGELHMVPPHKDAHQGLGMDFLAAVLPAAKAAGLVCRYETGLFRGDHDFRVPDLQFRRTDQGSERGSEGAELVVEIRSPEDETYRKLPFYAALGVREVLVLHPDDRRAELFRLIDGELRPVSAAGDGLHCETLDVYLDTVDGMLRIRWAEGSVDI